MPEDKISEEDLKYEGLDIAKLKRPDPPSDLRADAKVMWKEIVEKMPEGFFTAEVLPMLRIYCEALARTKRLSIKLDELQVNLSDKEDILNYYRLFGILERCTRHVKLLQEQLCIKRVRNQHVRGVGQQESANKDFVPVKEFKPWDFESDSLN